jgi:regulator of protease activity HflC (stomatin/prohibitin superfamily)
MAIEDQQTYRRATQAALLGLFVQLILALAMLLIGLWAQSPALYAATWHLFAGLPIWIILAALYNQHRLERVETLEAERLAGADAQAAALFDVHGDQLAIAKRRLAQLYHWGLGLIGLTVAVYLVAVGLSLLAIHYPHWQDGTLVAVGGASDAAAVTDQGVSRLALLFLTAAVAFIAFIVGRYEAGMTQVEQWKQLRGGASFMMGSAVIALLTTIGAACASFGFPSVLKVMALVIPALSALLGVEILLNFILALYRPRRAGEAPRAAFDSRALGMLTSPQSIAKTINDTINYQFGFEVSRSWFYRLLAKAVTPLFLVGLAVLWLISGVVIVPPSQQAVLTHFGQLQPADNPMPLEPGIHLKWPWPIDAARKYDVGQVHLLQVGSAPKGTKTDTALLWTNPHVEGKEEYLVTAPTPLSRQVLDGAAQAGNAKAAGVSLIGGQLYVQYRIRAGKGLIDYVQHLESPEQMLRNLAEREMAKFFVTQDIDTLLGQGRIGAGSQLRQRLQQAADEKRLGLEVLYAGLSALHPPQESEVAAAFHEQIMALQKKQSAIEKAKAQAIQTRTAAAGSESAADQLWTALSAFQSLADDVNKMSKSSPLADSVIPPEMIDLCRRRDAAWRDLTEKLAAARGDAGSRIATAMAFRWTTVLAERARVHRFTAEQQAYAQAPKLFLQRQYLQALSDGLQGRRKIIVTSEYQLPPTFRLDLKDTAAGIQSILQNQ